MNKVEISKALYGYLNVGCLAFLTYHTSMLTNHFFLSYWMLLYLFNLHVDNIRFQR